MCNCFSGRNTKVVHLSGDHVYEGDRDDNDDEYDDDDDNELHVSESHTKGFKETSGTLESVRHEATVLVDNVLAESVNIISEQQQNRNDLLYYAGEAGDGDQPDVTSVVVVGMNTDSSNRYNDSESENYAITCDDVDGLDVIKSPTIESMSGKSFDDNISFTDENLQSASVVTAQATLTSATFHTNQTSNTATLTTVPVQSTITSTVQHSQQQQQTTISQKSPTRSFDDIKSSDTNLHVTSKVTTKGNNSNK